MTGSNISRRSVAKGAAWSVPALTVAAAAPATAASPVASVVGSSNYTDTYLVGRTSTTIDGLINTPTGCSYTVSNGPASVTNLSATYWLPVSNYTFSAGTSNGWTVPKLDSSKGTKTGPTTGLTYYPYTTTYAGTGSTSTTCGPTYSFQAPAVTTTAKNPNGSYFYQLSYTLNGTSTTNPLRSINNP